MFSVNIKVNAYKSIFFSFFSSDKNKEKQMKISTQHLWIIIAKFRVKGESNNL